VIARELKVIVCMCARYVVLTAWRIRLILNIRIRQLEASRYAGAAGFNSGLMTWTKDILTRNTEINGSTMGLDGSAKRQSPKIGI